MDVKHDPQRYAEVTNTDIDSGVLLASRDVLRSSHIAYEFRTTVAPEIHDIEAIRHVAQFCGAGAKLVLQGFRPAGVLCPSFRNCLATSMTQLLQFQKIAEGQGCTASITSSSHVVLPHFQHKAGVF
jgi:pyruvate-formate lyase-activating enzyme